MSTELMLTVTQDDKGVSLSAPQGPVALPKYTLRRWEQMEKIPGYQIAWVGHGVDLKRGRAAIRLRPIIAKLGIERGKVIGVSVKVLWFKLLTFRFSPLGIEVILHKANLRLCTEIWQFICYFVHRQYDAYCEQRLTD